jgi:hypothetical protein
MHGAFLSGLREAGRIHYAFARARKGLPPRVGRRGRSAAGLCLPFQSEHARWPAQPCLLRGKSGRSIRLPLPTCGLARTRFCPSMILASTT